MQFKILNLSMLVAFATATLPPIVYRGDARSPATIRAAGGFLPRGGSFGEPKDSSMSYDQHVKMEPGKPGYNQDPFISTSKDYDWIVGYFGRHFKGRDVWIYYIKTAGLKNAIDINEAYIKDGIENNHAIEKEVAVKHNIPWSHVTRWDKYRISADGSEKTLLN
uniref:EC35 protein n=1 Tax=Colletotrichum higginsianum TaxID=80884 RepID=I2G7B1_9PEZI|nr:EC35 protein [Colletotrichum higginsianum]